MEEVENRYIDAPRKELFRLQIPYVLRFSIIWTLFFVIVGVLIQYLSLPNQIFSEVLVAFFTTNYVAWFASFGNFTNVTLYPAAMDFVYSLIGHWYYFFYTGGLISLIWGFLSWLIHFEFVFKKSDKPIEKEIAPVVIEKVVEQPVFIYKGQRYELEEWIDQGLKFLSERNLSEAELIYNQARRAYNPQRDPDQKVYKRILDFYSEIMEEKSSYKSREVDTWEG